MTANSDFATLAAEFLSRGGDVIPGDYDRFEHDFRQLLAWPPDRVGDPSLLLRCIVHGGAYATWKWDDRMVALHEPCSHAIAAWSTQPDLALDLLCHLYDLAYFIVWCFEGSNTDQARKILPDMRRLGECAGHTRPGRLDRHEGPLPVAYLTRSAEPTSATSLCMKHVLAALASQPNRYRPLVYVLDHLDPGVPDWLDPIRPEISILGRLTPAETIETVAAKAASDGVVVMLAADNTAVPTVLFSRRCAPVQGFLQIGLPAWGALNLDFVYNGFGFDPAQAGWGRAAVFGFTPPWDLDELAGSPQLEEIAAVRSLLPPSGRVIGCYTRLVKITEAYLQAVERILLRHSDVCLLLGGTGDPSAIARFIAASPVGDRMVLQPGFVPGRAWARVLHLFLDTWPFQGGGSIREVTVLGVPTVSIHSAEMPGMDLEKDQELIATNWDGFVELALELLGDQACYRRAQERAISLAARLSDRAAFDARFLSDLDGAVARAQVAG